MEIIRTVVNFLLFAVFAVSLLWMTIGFWVGVIWMIVTKMNKKPITRKMVVLTIGWLPTLIGILLLWIVFNIILQLLGVSPLPTPSV